MAYVLAGVSVIAIFLVLADAFEAMLLPRRITHHFRFARFFYVSSWKPWAAVARAIPPGKRRNHFLSFFGPLSILLLISTWAVSRSSLVSPVRSAPNSTAAGARRDSLTIRAEASRTSATRKF